MLNLENHVVTLWMFPVFISIILPLLVGLVRMVLYLSLRILTSVVRLPQRSMVRGADAFE